MADSPRIIHISNSGEISFDFYDEAGALKNLSAATKITIEFFAVPGTAIRSLNTVDHAANFDTTDLADGELILKWTSSTFDSSILGGGTTRRLNVRVQIVTADWPTPGYIPDEYRTVLFSK